MSVLGTICAIRTTGLGLTGQHRQYVNSAHAYIKTISPYCCSLSDVTDIRSVHSPVRVGVARAAAASIFIYGFNGSCSDVSWTAVACPE